MQRKSFSSTKAEGLYARFDERVRRNFPLFHRGNWELPGYTKRKFIMINAETPQKSFFLSSPSSGGFLFRFFPFFSLSQPFFICCFVISAVFCSFSNKFHWLRCCARGEFSETFAPNASENFSCLPARCIIFKVLINSPTIGVQLQSSSWLAPSDYLSLRIPSDFRSVAKQLICQHNPERVHLIKFTVCVSLIAFKISS